MFILFTENEVKRSFHPHYTVCATNGILSLLLTIILLLTPYSRLLIPRSSSLYSLLVSRLLLTVLPLTFPFSLFDLIDIDDYDYASKTKTKHIHSSLTRPNDQRLKVLRKCIIQSTRNKTILDRAYDLRTIPEIHS
jgi:hypothetical protein